MGSFLRFVILSAVVLGILVGAARLVAIRWWQVPDDDAMLGASITPTLRPGDWVLLWRGTPPAFGALTVCPDPEDDSRVVIARLVGEEGDTVTIDGARVIINDHEALTETSCKDIKFKVNEPTNGSEVEQFCNLEAMGGVLHMRGELAGLRQPLKTTRKINEGQIFLVSDNRAYPYDSRRYGSIERDTCKETIFFRLTSAKGFTDTDSRFTYVH
jgi:signal peptidase I